MRIYCVFAPQQTFSRKFAFCARAEIEHAIATIFQPGGRSEISARAEIHHVIRALVWFKDKGGVGPDPPGSARHPIPRSATEIINR